VVKRLSASPPVVYFVGDFYTVNSWEFVS